MDKVQLFLRLHQLFGLEKEDLLLLFQPPLLFQLAHLGLGDLADEHVALGLVGPRVPEVGKLGGVPGVARGLVGLHPVFQQGRLVARQKG